MNIFSSGFSGLFSFSALCGGKFVWKGQHAFESNVSGKELQKNIDGLPLLGVRALEAAKKETKGSLDRFAAEELQRNEDLQAEHVAGLANKVEVLELSELEKLTGHYKGLEEAFFTGITERYPVLAGKPKEDLIYELVNPDYAPFFEEFFAEKATVPADLQKTIENVMSGRKELPRSFMNTGDIVGVLGFLSIMYIYGRSFNLKPQQIDPYGLKWLKTGAVILGLGALNVASTNDDYNEDGWIEKVAKVGGIGTFRAFFALPNAVNVYDQYKQGEKDGSSWKRVENTVLKGVDEIVSPLGVETGRSFTETPVETLKKQLDFVLEIKGLEKYALKDGTNLNVAQVCADLSFLNDKPAVLKKFGKKKEQKYLKDTGSFPLVVLDEVKYNAWLKQAFSPKRVKQITEFLQDMAANPNLFTIKNPGLANFHPNNKEGQENIKKAMLGEAFSGIQKAISVTDPILGMQLAHQMEKEYEPQALGGFATQIIPEDITNNVVETTTYKKWLRLKNVGLGTETKTSFNAAGQRMVQKAGLMPVEMGQGQVLWGLDGVEMGLLAGAFAFAYQKLATLGLQWWNKSLPYQQKKVERKKEKDREKVKPEYQRKWKQNGVKTFMDGIVDTHMKSPGNDENIAATFNGDGPNAAETRNFFEEFEKAGVITEEEVNNAVADLRDADIRKDFWKQMLEERMEPALERPFYWNIFEKQTKKEAMVWLKDQIDGVRPGTNPDFSEHIEERLTVLDNYEGFRQTIVEDEPNRKVGEIDVEFNTGDGTGTQKVTLKMPPIKERRIKLPKKKEKNVIDGRNPLNLKGWKVILPDEAGKPQLKSNVKFRVEGGHVQIKILKSKAHKDVEQNLGRSQAQMVNTGDFRQIVSFKERLGTS